MKSELGQLKSIVIAQYLMKKTGLGQEALAQKLFPDETEPRKKIQRWIAGGGISSKNQSIICRAHPESQILFDLPLYTLLSQKPLAADDIEQLLLQYRKLNAPGIYWELPANSMLNPNPGRPIYGRSNSQALAESGSVDAFAIILGVIRQERLLDLDGSVESKRKRNAAISYHLIQAARAFPNVARHPVFNEIWPILYTSFKDLWLKSLPDPTSMMLDDDLMKTYITMDTEYVLWRGGYGRITGTYELIELPAPVIQAVEWVHVMS